MQHRIHHGVCIAAVLGLFGGWVPAASAAGIGFSGGLDLVATELAGARYFNTPLGQTFSGGFSYGIEAQASTDPLFPGDYDFSTPPFGGSISDGGTLTTGTSGIPVQISVRDDVAIDQDTADLINSLLNLSVSAGTIMDIADIDTAFVTPSGGEVVFGLSFVSLDGSAWSGVDFDNFPALTGNYDAALFFISEADALGDPLYEGFGLLDTVAPVPLPAALWLFGGGLGLLGMAGRRRGR